MPSLSANDLMFLRMLNCLVASMGFMLIASLLYYVLTSKGTGHRRLLLLGIVMFAGRSINLMFAAYAIYVHSHRESVWASSISVLFILTVAYYGFITRGDIVKTLQRSEAIDQIWKRRIVNASQVALNVQHIADYTLENVRKLG